LSDDRSASDIVEKVSGYALPFLDQMHTVGAMEDYLKKQRYPPEIIYLAILKCSRGDTIGGCGILSELKESGWRVRAEEVARRVGCA
jgi:hypothetical protein